MEQNCNVETSGSQFTPTDAATTAADPSELVRRCPVCGRPFESARRIGPGDMIERRGDRQRCIDWDDEDSDHPVVIGHAF